MDDSEDFTSVITAKLKEDLPAFRQRDSIQFAVTNPDTKTVTLEPGAGKTWYISKIRIWTDEKPTDNGLEGSKVSAVISISGGAGDIALLDQSEVIDILYKTCSISINCMKTFGQRLKVINGENTIYVEGAKTGVEQPTMYLEIEGVEE